MSTRDFIQCFDAPLIFASTSSQCHKEEMVAPVLPARQTNAFEPPPSSMLATHVVHGNGVPDFDRDSFNQLLAEALGSDEHGQPNLGADVAVNHKLIRIIFQVGIEQTLDDNPFHSAVAAGKATSQLKTCLEVLQLAIERSPQVLFVKSQDSGTPGQGPLLYCWLIPRLFPLLNHDGLQDAILQLLNVMLRGDRRCSTTDACGQIWEYLRSVAGGKNLYQKYLSASADMNRPP